MWEGVGVGRVGERERRGRGNGWKECEVGGGNGVREGEERNR